MCIRLREVPNKHVDYNSQMGDSDENITVEEEIEEIDIVKTIYYYEHRTKNLDREHLQNQQLPKSMLEQLVRYIDIAN